MSKYRRQLVTAAFRLQRIPLRLEQFEPRNAPLALLDLVGMGGIAFGGLVHWDPFGADTVSDPALDVALLGSDQSTATDDGSAVVSGAPSSTTEAVVAASLSTPTESASHSAADQGQAEIGSLPAGIELPLAPVGARNAHSAASHQDVRLASSSGNAAPAITGHLNPGPQVAVTPTTAVGDRLPAMGMPADPLKSLTTSPQDSSVAPMVPVSAGADANSAVATVQSSNTLVGEPITVQGHVVQAPLLDTPPQPTPEQQQAVANHVLKTGPEFPPPNGSVADVRPTEGDRGGSQGPGTNFVFFQSNLLGAGQGGSLNVTSEASVSSNGQAAFQTGNFYDSLNGNYGDAGSWRFINPSTTFPTGGDFAGGFCCDQRVAEDQIRHVTMWYMQYNDTGPAGSRRNAGRLAAFINPYDMQTQTIHFWDLPSVGTFGAPLNRSVDYPNMQVSNNFVYISSNEGPSGSGFVNSADVLRFPLSQIASGAGTLTGTRWRLGSDISLAATNGATTTMFFGEVTGGNSVRVFRQNEADTNLTPTNINGLPNTFGGTHTSIAPGGVNWTARTDNRMQVGWQGRWAGGQSVIGFLWDSAQGSGRPQPFVRGLLLNTGLGVIGTPDIFNNNFAFELPMVATNGRGDLGGTLWIGGGTWGNPGTQIAIADDVSGYPTNGGWSLFFGDNGTAANGNMGDFNGAQRAQVGSGNTWVGSSYVYSPGVSHRFYWFGRERDRTRPDNLNNVPVAGDTLGTALNTGIVNSGNYTGTNRMWNAAFGLRHVGMYRFNAAAAGTMTAATVLPTGGDGADTILRLFNSAGTQLAVNDDCFPGTLYSCINNFVLPNTDTYYLGVSGFPNFSYNPNVGGSGVNTGDTRFGDFRLNVSLVAAPIATRFVVTAPATATAGQPFAVTVRATDNFNNTATGYRGTVTFSSTNDPAASFPPNYTFTVADNGSHTFNVPPGVTLRTASPPARNITVQQVGAPGINGSTSVTVNPAAADHFDFSSPASTTAGDAFSVTITARDPFNNVATGYAGTVSFVSTDPFPATLPAPYPFNPGVDQGTHTFTNEFALYTTDNQDVTASATGIAGSVTNNIAVNPAAAASLVIAAPTDVASNTQFDMTVSAIDPFGNVDVNYNQATSWSTTDLDPGVVLEGPYTYTTGPGADNGIHFFTDNGLGETTLQTQGFQDVTITDGSISGTATVCVDGPCAATPTNSHFRPAHRLGQHVAAITAAALVSPVQPVTTTRTSTTSTTTRVLSRRDVGRIDRVFAGNHRYDHRLTLLPSRREAREWVDRLFLSSVQVESGLSG